MKNKLKFSVLLLAVLMLITGSVIIASADSGDDWAGDVGDTPIDTPVDEPIDTPVDEPIDTPVDEPVDTPVEPDPEYVEPDPGYEDPGAGYEDPGYVEPDDSYYYYYDDSPMYYGDGYDSGNDIDAGSVSDYADLYDTDKVDDAELEANAWSAIVLNDNGKNKGTADFSAIKSNTAAEDNSNWILFVGIALIVLSVLGIIYFIAATIHQKKHPRKTLPDDPRAHTEHRAPAAKRASSHRYSDGYESYAERRRVSTRSDTAEITLPDNVGEIDINL